MKINIVTGPFCSLPPVGFGAVEKLWYDCGKYFASCGHEVAILARRGTNELQDEYIDGMHIRRYMHYISSGNLKLNLIYDFLYSLRMTRLLPAADITVVNSFWLPVFAPLRKKVAGRIVYNVNRFPKGQLRLYKYLDRFTFASNAVYQAGLNQTPAIESRSCMIPNPIRTDVFFDKGLDCHDGINVIYAGRIAPEKGLDVLVKAFSLLWKKYPQTRLRLIGATDIENGGGGPAYVQKLRMLADGVAFEIIQPIRDPEFLAAELRKGDIFVYPSCADRGEAFGVAPLEAMAVGLSVIVSDLACFRDFVTDGENGLVFDHHDQAADSLLASKIELLIADETLRRCFGAAGSLTAKEFSVSNIAQRHLADFDQLLKG